MLELSNSNDATIIGVEQRALQRRPVSAVCKYNPLEKYHWCENGKEHLESVESDSRQLNLKIALNVTTTPKAMMELIVVHPESS